MRQAGHGRPASEGPQLPTGGCCLYGGFNPPRWQRPSSWSWRTGCGLRHDTDSALVPSFPVSFGPFIIERTARQREQAHIVHRTRGYPPRPDQINGPAFIKRRALSRRFLRAASAGAAWAPPPPDGRCRQRSRYSETGADSTSGLVLAWFSGRWYRRDWDYPDTSQYRRAGSDRHGMAWSNFKRLRHAVQGTCLNWYPPTMHCTACHGHPP